MMDTETLKGLTWLCGQTGDCTAYSDHKSFKSSAYPKTVFPQIQDISTI